MKIIVLFGPNLNLIGLQAARHGERVTLDKINRSLRRYARTSNLELKLFQTHRSGQAISFLQRNRNWADGLLIAPMAWSAANHELKETLRYIQVPVVQVLLPDSYSDYHNENESIFTGTCLKTFIGHPENVFSESLKFLAAEIKDATN